MIRTDETVQGKGIWKMNVSNILKEEFRHDFEVMWNEWQVKKANYNDITVWWDLGKKQIKA